MSTVKIRDRLSCYRLEKALTIVEGKYGIRTGTAFRDHDDIS
jgi:hypothetical protein